MLFLKKRKNKDNKKGFGISYHDDLLQKLTKDHKILLKNYTKLLKAARSKNQSKVQHYLNKFILDFKIHHRSELVQLYTYIKKHTHDTIEQTEVEKFRKSAIEIYDSLINFLENYRNRKLSKKEFNELYEKLNSFKVFLQNRIQSEEKKLYTLYKNTPKD